MNYQRLGWIQIQNSVLNQVWIGAGHVASFDRTVPLWLDWACEALDLKTIRWTRSKDTPSFKWSNLDHWIQIWRLQFKQRRKRYLGLGFHRRRQGLRPGGWSPASSGGFCAMVKLWRCAGGRGDLESLTVVVDCFQRRAGKATGVVQGSRCFGQWTTASIWGELDQANWSGRSTGEK
jgi:hypothetical protein